MKIKLAKLNQIKKNIMKTKLPAWQYSAIKYGAVELRLDQELGRRVANELLKIHVYMFMYNTLGMYKWLNMYWTCNHGYSY